jgi:gamma-glutamylcyclotransferase (GGCT)/AIG2-like uncharacterized protein YtfP
MGRHLVFVYGTLRRGVAASMSVRFPGATFVADAEAGGSLYDLGAYPGLMLNGSGSTVVGEVYEVSDELLGELDEFEATSRYRRRQVEVDIGGDRRECWAYEPDPSCHSPRTLIPSGDWAEYVLTKANQSQDTRPSEVKS